MIENISTDELVENIFFSIDQWHNEKKKIFDLEIEKDNVLSLTKKLCYHNYVAWHLIEEYQNGDENIVKFVYEGGLKHNPARNECMQLIDQIYVNFQNPDAETHSEGMGSIVDKLSNDYIKYVHLVENNDERKHLLIDQVNFHVNSLKKLNDEILNGQKRIMVFQKFKINGY